MGGPVPTPGPPSSPRSDERRPRPPSRHPALAAAGYYQGLESVRRIGMLPETQRYVANVMALRPRFGG